MYTTDGHLGGTYCCLVGRVRADLLMNKSDGFSQSGLPKDIFEQLSQRNLIVDGGEKRAKI